MDKLGSDGSDWMEQHLLTHRLVAVLRTDTADEALAAGRAVLAGGARLVEVTLTVPDALRVVRYLCEEAPEGAVIGAGTVLSADDVEAAVDAGARFLVSPDVHAEVIHAARACGVLHVPGAMTPTEVLAAVRLGSRIVKVFPIASLGGAAHVRALRGPIPRLPLLVTGGVDLETLAEFLAAGATAVGLTTTLIRPEWLRDGDYAKITERTRAYVERLARRESTPRGVSLQ